MKISEECQSESRNLLIAFSLHFCLINCFFEGGNRLNKFLAFRVTKISILSLTIKLQTALAVKHIFQHLSKIKYNAIRLKIFCVDRLI